MGSHTKYAIVANPVSGKLDPKDKAQILKRIAEIFPASVCGLNTRSAQEFLHCVRDEAEKCDVLIVAGGDGTFSRVLDAVDLSQTTLAFLPFGTGNALRFALGYRGGVFDIATRIRFGSDHCCDLIHCDNGKKAFMLSLGVDGEAIRRYERYRAKGMKGLSAHVPAALNAAIRHRPADCTMEVDGISHHVSTLWSLVIVKQPFFGMGLNVVPQARWDDGYMHTKVFASGLPEMIAGLFTGFTVGNKRGLYRKMKRLTVRLNHPLTLQIDGELGRTDDLFSFSVLPGVLRLRS